MTARQDDPRTRGPFAGARARLSAGRWSAAQRLVSLMDRLRILDMLLAGRRALPRRALVILNYHRVLDGHTELDQGVVSATAAELDQEIELIAHAGTPLSEADLRLIARGERRLPDNPVMVTFDDGYADNHDAALPVLRRRGVPATFFVTTGYVESGRLPWWDRLSYVLQRSAARRIYMGYPAPMVLDLSGPAQRRRARRVLLQVLKHAYRLDYDRFFAELEASAQVEVDEAALARGLFMSWRQIVALRDAGMGIGSHTHTHRPLQTLGPQEVRRELTHSAELLREHLGERPRTIAYPNGRPVANVGLRAMVREAGYLVGFTFVPGAVRLDPDGPGIDWLNLPRLPVDGVDHRALARCKFALAAPRLI